MSKLLDQHSIPSTVSPLQLFTVPTTQVAVRRSFWSECHLQNPCTNSGPYNIVIPPDQYLLHLSKNYLYMKVRIVRGDGTILQHQDDDGNQDDDVGPINLLAKTFLKQIKIYLNGKLISDSGDLYAYKSFFETQLNYGVGAKESQLEAALYERDSGQNCDSAENTGWQARCQPFLYSNVVEMMAPIHSEMFMQNRYLINQSEIRLEIYRNSDAFCLMAFRQNPQYKIEVQHVSLFVKKVEVVESINLAIESMLQTTSAKYPIRRVQMTSFHITENRRSTPLGSLFSGQCPRRMVIALCHAEAKRGSYTRSPFNFENFNIAELKITSGTTTVPSTPYRLDFDRGICVRAFVQMFEGLGIAREDKGNGITLSDFQNGNAFYCYELGAEGTDESDVWELQRDGTTTLDIQFGAALPPGGVECIVYAEFDSLMMIDKNRQAFLDYSA